MLTFPSELCLVLIFCLFKVVIDVEWGAFGDNGVLDFMKTEFDREVDRNSLLAGSFTYLNAMFCSIFVTNTFCKSDSKSFSVVNI